MFGLDEERRPREYIENNFEDLGDVVIDHATGLMWQKSGSDTTVTYQKAQAYIEDLNRQRFAGYDTWRLPTIPELMSLIESEEHSNGLYLNPIFDDTQRWCWSADTCSSGSAWHVSFRSGHVNWNDLFDNEGYVRGVRSIKHKKESIRTKEKPGQHQKAQKQTPEQQNEKIGLDSEIMKRLMSDEHSIVMASYANIPNEEKDLYSDALIRKLSSASTQDRLMALTALFAIYRKKSFSSLTRMVDDTSSAVRRRAVFYLGEIRALKSLPLITERLSDKDRNVRAAARTAYKKITGRDASPGHFS
ncbi:MAG: DUF1566 domain-containing protein [bacterium]|nr:DUF1566 domain-containing protein [bacterium]